MLWLIDLYVDFIIYEPRSAIIVLTSKGHLNYLRGLDISSLLPVSLTCEVSKAHNFLESSQILIRNDHVSLWMVSSVNLRDVVRGVLASIVVL